MKSLVKRFQKPLLKKDKIKLCKRINQIKLKIFCQNKFINLCRLTKIPQVFHKHNFKSLHPKRINNL